VDEFYEQHLARVRTATTDRLGRKDLPQWIERNTSISGRKFSFKDHEYQLQILTDDSPELVIRKSAQTGISEMALRAAAGLVMIMPDSFRIGYTFPTASFATDYAKTRFNPIITGSPALRAAITSDDIDKADIKTFGPGKEVYFKGAATGNAAISTTLDMLIHDELSFSDQDVIGDYTSRLIHSQYKWRISLSTPTYPGDPIDEAFLASRRMWNMCKCEHCNHRFVPEYYEHVKIPGYDKHLDEITKEGLHLIRYQEAQFLCPKCIKPTSLQPEHREWVCENPTENHIARGYQVQPFDAPNVVSLSDLIIASTKYANKAKFRQFSLGRPAADAESGLTEEDIERIGVQLAGTPFSSHVMGIDLGLTCHFMVGGVAPDGQLVVVHSERVPLRMFRQRYTALVTQYRVSIKVSDIMPYTDLIMSMSEQDPNLYGGLYVAKGGMEVYDVRRKEEDNDSALAGLRQVAINRNALFDRLMAEIRPADESAEPGIRIAKSAEWDLIKAHLTDMKRAQAALRNGEFTTMWQKSNKGKDHYHHALGYLWVASQMRGVAVGSFGAGIPLVTKFKVTGPPKK
jgi:hypothetical protein